MYTGSLLVVCVVLVAAAWEYPRRLIGSSKKGFSTDRCPAFCFLPASCLPLRVLHLLLSCLRPLSPCSPSFDAPSLLLVASAFGHSGAVKHAAPPSLLSDLSRYHVRVRLCRHLLTAISLIPLPFHTHRVVYLGLKTFQPHKRSCFCDGCRSQPSHSWTRHSTSWQPSRQLRALQAGTSRAGRFELERGLRLALRHAGGSNANTVCGRLYCMWPTQYRMCRFYTLYVSTQYSIAGQMPYCTFLEESVLQLYAHCGCELTRRATSPDVAHRHAAVHAGPADRRPRLL